MLIYELRILTIDESRECCDSYISRWIDNSGKHYCQECIGKIDGPWRESFSEATIVDLEEELEAECSSPSYKWNNRIK